MKALVRDTVRLGDHLLYISFDSFSFRVVQLWWT